MKSIVVSGATGFVGQNLIPYLQKNIHDCTIMPVSVRYGDTFMSQANIYIHLAGKAHDTRNITKSEEYYEANYLLTQTVYNRFLEDKEAHCFIYMSSVKAIAERPDSEIVDENYLEHVETVYGKSKKLAEDYIISKIPINKRVYILRPCMIHGPGNKGNLNLLFQLIKKGIPYPLGAFNNQRSFLSIENLCFIIKELIERRDIGNGIFHVADTVAISTNRVVELIGEVLHKKIYTFNVPQILIKSIFYVGGCVSDKIGPTQLNKLTDSFIVSNQKILKALNKELPVNTEAGLKVTIATL